MLDLKIDVPLIDVGPFAFGESLAEGEPAPKEWEPRLKIIFPSYTWYPFSPPHRDLWEWVESIAAGQSARPFCALWPRGRGKSTHSEMAVSDLGARGARSYALYVSETQDQADKHVLTIRGMLESENMRKYFPAAAAPKVSKTGGQTWRRNILTTSNGFTIEAIGLDKAVRGQKIDWVRPDLIVLDDIDARHDTEAATKKKQDTITTSILPAGSPHCAVLFAQNLIKKDSIAHRLSKRPGSPGAADWLVNRVISGPFKAVENLQYEFKEINGEWRCRVIGGVSLWDGFTLEVVEREINRAGTSSFEIESQHNIDADDPNALLSAQIINATRVKDAPDLFTVAIGVDPSGGAGQVGIVAGGLSKASGTTHGYTLKDYSTPTGTPANVWGAAALMAYWEQAADIIFVERNFGGDMGKETIRGSKLVRDAYGVVRAATPDDIVFESKDELEKYEGNLTPVLLVLSGASVGIVEVTASRGKEVRAQPVAALYQIGKIHHVGFLPDLEKQWTQWVPGTKPSPDRLDAEVWVWAGLGLVEQVNTRKGSNPFFG